MKLEYLIPDVKVVKFEIEDVITTSFEPEMGSEGDKDRVDIDDLLNKH